MFERLGSGQTVSADHYNRVVDVLESLMRPVTSGGDFEFAYSQAQPQLLDRSKKGFWAKIGDDRDGAAYSFQEIISKIDGTNDENQGGVTGEVDPDIIFPGVEVNGSEGVSPGKIVWMEPDPSGYFFNFDAGGGGTDVEYARINGSPTTKTIDGETTTVYPAKLITFTPPDTWTDGASIYIRQLGGGLSDNAFFGVPGVSRYFVTPDGTADDDTPLYIAVSDADEVSSVGYPGLVGTKNQTWWGDKKFRKKIIAQGTDGIGGVTIESSPTSTISAIGGSSGSPASSVGIVADSTGVASVGIGSSGTTGIDGGGIALVANPTTGGIDGAKSWIASEDTFQLRLGGYYGSNVLELYKTDVYHYQPVPFKARNGYYSWIYSTALYGSSGITYGESANVYFVSSVGINSSGSLVFSNGVQHFLNGLFIGVDYFQVLFVVTINQAGGGWTFSNPVNVNIIDSGGTTRGTVLVSASGTTEKMALAPGTYTIRPIHTGKLTTQATNSAGYFKLVGPQVDMTVELLDQDAARGKLAFNDSHNSVRKVAPSPMRI